MRRPVLLSTALVLGISTHGAAAQDASFGCKVLLCAAASSPGWSGIPYCVPVMTQLFQMLKRFRPWPTCPEGNAGGLGYEPYEECPAGSTPASQGFGNGDNGGGIQFGDPNAPFCARPNPNGGRCSGGDSGTCEPEYILTSRTPRPEEHYVDIRTANGTSRFRFSLRGY